jgi:hypothetical protein
VGPSAGPSVLASVPRGGAFELSQEHKVRHAPCTPHLAARLQPRTPSPFSETKTNVHLMQQTSYISSMAPRTMLDMLVQKEMGVLAAVNNAMQSEES